VGRLFSEVDGLTAVFVGVAEFLLLVLLELFRERGCESFGRFEVGEILDPWPHKGNETLMINRFQIWLLE